MTRTYEDTRCPAPVIRLRRVRMVPYHTGYQHIQTYRSFRYIPPGEPVELWELWDVESGQRTQFVRLHEECSAYEGERCFCGAKIP